MSWWDYGYQITAMANRTILVDNNTWNNTHISRVGQVSRLQLWNDHVSVRAVLQVLTVLTAAVLQAMASTEERAYEIMRELDVSYVLVIFGGLTGYSSDGKCPTFCLTEDVENPLFCFFSSLCDRVLHLFDGHPSEPQTSTNSCGWFVSEGAPTRASTSRSTTTTPPPESSEWTVRARPSSSTASCTRCATTASARSTQRPVSNARAHMCIYIYLSLCVS